MRIQHPVKTDMAHGKNVRPETAQPAPFQEMMNRSQKNLFQENMSQLLSQIEEKGKQLAEQRTLRHLKQYKQLVRQIVEEVVHHGLRLEEKQGITRGRPKTYRVIEQVNQKLVQLTEDVLDQERTSLHILSLVGEIRGMLVNLYT